MCRYDTTRDSAIYLARGVALAAIVSVQFSCGGGSDASISFALSFPEARSAEALDGRLLLMIARDSAREPRFQITAGPTGQQVFGIEVDGMEPGEEATIDGSVFGFPRPSLAEVPPGEYWVQGLLNRYETFFRSDGHVVKFPPDKGEGQKWNAKPGNLYSTPQKLWVDPLDNRTIEISLDNEIPPFPEREDTKYIKHVRIQSELLTEFWGRPMFLEAIILLPWGFDEHPNARYPLFVYQGHHHRVLYLPAGFRETPPEPGHSSSDRSDVAGYAQLQEDAAHQLYRDWTSPGFPRMIAVTMQHANPVYDDSYAVNSENLGPYGDALTYELIPYIEEQFRGIGEGWARALTGGSTGGWETLGAQIKYPDEYNGAWATCPDPIDFRAFSTVNIYEDENAYYIDSSWKRTPRPSRRDSLGHVSITMREDHHLGLVVGPKNRSGDWWDAYEAVFTPVGEDGYPKPIWDKYTGEIDHEVAEYWRENYDLRYILERDWATLGPKLRGKIHIYIGDMDDHYSTNAVYLMEEFLESTTNPYYDGEVDYGDRREHCWTSDHTTPNSVARLRYVQMFAPRMVERMLRTAPRGADVTSWRY